VHAFSSILMIRPNYINKIFILTAAFQDMHIAQLHYSI